MQYWQGWRKGAAKSQAETSRDKVASTSAQQWGLITAGKAVGIENIRAILRDARRRTCDSHHAQMGAIGYKASGDCDDADMGDISVSGDHYHTHQEHRSQAPIWAAALAAGAGGALLAWALTRDPTEQPDTEPPPKSTVGVGLEVEPGGAIQ